MRRIAAALALASLVVPSRAAPAAADPPGDLLAARVPGRRLVRALRDGGPQERIEAARRLGRIGAPAPAVAALLAALPGDRTVRGRTAIAEALARRGDPGAAPVLVAELDARPDDGAAPALLAALGAVAGDAAARPLLRYARDARLRDPARRALRRLGPGAVPAIRSALAEPAGERVALELLAAAPSPAALPALVARLDHADPSMRALVREALVRLADPRATPALLGRLRAAVDAAAAGPGEPAEVAQLLDALAAVGVAPTADVLDRAVAHLEDAAVLEAVVAVELAGAPARGAARLSALLAAPAAWQRVAAARAAVESRVPAAAPALANLAREPAFAEAALAALAELDGGAGVPALRQAALRAGPPPDAAAPEPAALGRSALRELAVALRRWPDHPDARAALGTLRGGLEGDPRALPLLALARDPAVAARIRRDLTAEAAPRRALAAHAAGLLGDAALAPALLARLGQERDGELRELLLRAVAASDPDRAFAARAALAVEASSGPPSPRRALAAPDAGRLREAARAARPRPRVLAAAALALDPAGASALPSLRALLDDRDPRVRLAAAEALRRLAPAAAEDALGEAARVEPDDAVHRALLDALSACRAGRPGAPRRGSQVLRFRVRVAGASGGERVRVDVNAPDGDWLRLPTWPGGEVVLADLPAGTADVRPRL